jgi:hypothetical protein
MKSNTEYLFEVTVKHELLTGKMAENLYIFVDESGHHARGEDYTVASCWCLSNHSPQNVLSDAQQKRIEQVVNSCGFDEVSELKGTQLPKSKLGSFLRTFEKFAYQDDTIDKSSYLWQEERPLRCSHHEFNPDLGKQILSKYMTEIDAPEALQRLALARILSPLTDADTLNLENIREIHLIPDAEIWATPATRVCELLKDTGGPTIEVETRKSHRTPGIQIADLMAYSRRNYIKDGECEDAANFLTELSL